MSFVEERCEKHLRFYNPDKGERCPDCVEPDPMEDFGPVTVGDLNSDARGTGARRSAGKPQWFQLPFWATIPAINYYRSTIPLWDSQKLMTRYDRIMEVTGKMADWQRGGAPFLLDMALGETLYVLAMDLDPQEQDSDTIPFRALVSSVRVLEFGAIKYAIGNWAKGMPWNTAFTCTMSHLLKYLAGMNDDEESRQPHLAHAAVNIMFLIAYRTLYPEGDDRIKQFKRPEPTYTKEFTVPLMPGAWVDVPGPVQVDMASGPDASVRAVYQHVGTGIKIKHWARGNFATGEVEYAHKNCQICINLGDRK